MNQSNQSQKMVKLAYDALEDKKGKNIEIIDIQGISVIAVQKGPGVKAVLSQLDIDGLAGGYAVQGDPPIGGDPVDVEVIAVDVL